MSRPFTFLAIVVFLLVALVNAIRVWFAIPTNIAGEPVPLAWSAIAIAVSMLLAIGVWFEIMSSARREEGVVREASRRGDTRSSRSTGGRGRVEWSDPETGLRLPARYFLFASAGVSPGSIRKAAEKYERILVGFDAGNVPPASLAAARSCEAELSIYVEGPGGPTGNAWAPDERARIRAAAASVGIRTDQKDWMEQWDEWGWKTYTFRQLEGYRRDGYSACEIDNLDRVTGDRDPDATIAFFKEFAERQGAGKLPRLILKNMSEEQLERVIQAIDGGELPRSMFSEFHISEKGSGDRRRQDELSSRIGIRTVASNDTYNYDAKGEFGLETQYAALFTPTAQQPAETQVAWGPATGQETTVRGARRA
jgi:hypothetical protein